jgi:hypothetical protein
MIYDVFFISYDEPNCEENWQRALQLHPDAKRIQGVKGIDVANLMCHEQSNTDKYWTVDGDNWLLRKLLFPANSDCLYFFKSLDPIDGDVCSLGSVKLWTKGSLINTDMSKGDFSKNATEHNTTVCITSSEHRYNSTPESTWKTCFRQMLKCYGGILPKDVIQSNVEKYKKFQHIDDGKNNAIWGYKALLDAQKYIIECDGSFDKINLINDYEWLKYKFNACAEDVKLLSQHSD